MKKIPLDLLKDSTDEGLEIRRFSGDMSVSLDDKTMGAHRDDHYIFFILESESGAIQVDFQKIILPACSIYYVLPNQVHHRIQTNGSTGWFLAIDTALVPSECRNVFEGRLQLQQPQVLNDKLIRQFEAVLSLLIDNVGTKGERFVVMAIHAFLESFLAMAANCYDQKFNDSGKFSRPMQITAQFRNLLTTEMRTMKSPSEFAARLNISETYLSEALKKTTGLPASHWIQQEVIIEAKRLLYYTQLTVKEIAHALGYADHSYFSRLFRKITGTSANGFRQQYLE